MKQIQKKCATIDNGTKQTSITMKQTFIGMKHAQKEPFSEQSPSKKEQFAVQSGTEANLMIVHSTI
jgi:hypothetical protein